MKKFLLVLSLVMFIAFAANPSAHAMTAYQKDVCDTWIHGSATAAAGSAAVLAQAPGTDNVALIGILGTLTVRLADVFNLDLDLESAKRLGKAVIANYMMLGVARTASEFLLGWIPGFGNTVNAGTAFALVEFLGWEIADLFDTGNMTATEIVGILNGPEASDMWDKLKSKSK